MTAAMTPVALTAISGVVKIGALIVTNVNKHFKRIWKHQIYGIILKVYMVTFLFILPILCHNLPYSVYFMERFVPSSKEMLRRELLENTRLVHEAWSYIGQQGVLSDHRKIMDTIGSSRKGRVQVPKNVTVFITVISVNRKKVHGYLTRIVAKLHRLIKEFEVNSGLKKYFAVALCNVDTWPIDNEELYKVATTLGLPIFERFARPIRHITDNEFAKEKDDYAYCLHESLRHNPDFVLLLEDDALPINNALRVIHRIVSFCYKRYSQYEQNQIAYFKLFHPSRLLQYFSLERERIPQLLALGAVFGTATFWLYLKFSQPKTNIYTIWIVTVLYFVLLFLCIGNPNILKIGKLLNTFQIVPSPSCCTPAMLFSSRNGKLVADYLRDTPRRAHPKDKILKSYLKETGFKGRMILPNQFDHIGLFSILGQDFLNPYYSN